MLSSVAYCVPDSFNIPPSSSLVAIQSKLGWHERHRSPEKKKKKTDFFLSCFHYQRVKEAFILSIGFLLVIIIRLQSITAGWWSTERDISFDHKTSDGLLSINAYSICWPYSSPAMDICRVWIVIRHICHAALLFHIENRGKQVEYWSSSWKQTSWHTHTQLFKRKFGSEDCLCGCLSNVYIHRLFFVLWRGL